MTNRDVLARLTNEQLAYILMSRSWEQFMFITIQQERSFFEKWLDEQYTQDGFLSQTLKLYKIDEDEISSAISSLRAENKALHEKVERDEKLIYEVENSLVFAHDKKLFAQIKEKYAVKENANG